MIVKQNSFGTKLYKLKRKYNHVGQRWSVNDRNQICKPKPFKFLAKTKLLLNRIWLTLTTFCPTFFGAWSMDNQIMKLIAVQQKTMMGDDKIGRGPVVWVNFKDFCIFPPSDEKFWKSFCPKMAFQPNSFRK